MLLACWFAISFCSLWCYSYGVLLVLVWCFMVVLIVVAPVVCYCVRLWFPPCGVLSGVVAVCFLVCVCGFICRCTFYGLP